MYNYRPLSLEQPQRIIAAKTIREILPVVEGIKHPIVDKALTLVRQVMYTAGSFAAAARVSFLKGFFSEFKTPRVESYERDNDITNIKK